MKGIAHFISGVTVASFFPQAVEAAVAGDPSFFILGGLAGILPDTLDFKFFRYFYRYDRYIEPDPEQLDPQPVADTVASALTQASAGKMVRIKLCAIRLAGGNWRQYRVEIFPESGEVRARFGPVVSTGQVPQPETRPAVCPEAVAPFRGKIRTQEELFYTVDIFDGPGLRLEPGPDGTVHIRFLPWHRMGSHSLTAGLALALPFFFWRQQAGWIAACAYLIHILEDQLGHMGSSLFFPFTRSRIPGLKWMRSTDALPNFALVWICGVLIFWNLYAAIPDPLYRFSFCRYFLIAAVIPFLAGGLIRFFLTPAARNPVNPIDPV